MGLLKDWTGGLIDDDRPSRRNRKKKGKISDLSMFGVTEQRHKKRNRRRRK